MRVFLDLAIGDRWDRHVPRPAIKCIDLAALARAVALAEDVVRDPALLPRLNAQSLAWRRALSAGCGQAPGPGQA